MAAIKRGDVKIYLVNADTVPTAIASTDIIAGEIISYEQSGGSKENETQFAFGGDIDKEKPIEQFELSFEFVPDMANADRWESYIYAVDTATTDFTLYTSAASTSTQPGDKLVALEVTQVDGGTTRYKTHLFNNCNITNLEMSHSADDNRTGTMTIKFSPQTKDGVANYITASTDLASMPAFNAIDNN